MLIETAFFKTCEDIIDTASYAKTNEEHLRGLMLKKINEECQLRQLEKNGVLPQCSYDLKKEKSCDLRVHFDGTTPEHYKPYGLCMTNWIEIKYFKHWSKQRVVNDLLRLCLLPKELPGKIKQNSRYFMLVIKNHNKGGKKGLQQIKSSGFFSINIDDNNYTLTINTYIYEFIPFYFQKDAAPLFSGYLVKILSFTFVDKNKDKQNKLYITLKPHTRTTTFDTKNQEECAHNINNYINSKKLTITVNKTPG